MPTARTLPAGSRPSIAFDSDHNIDMQDKFKTNGQWPSGRTYKNWRHGDARDISYPYNYQLFDFIADKGGLK
jgi:hypothetical protein